MTLYTQDFTLRSVREGWNSFDRKTTTYHYDDDYSLDSVISTTFWTDSSIRFITKERYEKGKLTDIIRTGYLPDQFHIVYRYIDDTVKVFHIDNDTVLDRILILNDSFQVVQSYKSPQEVEIYSWENGNCVNVKIYNIFQGDSSVNHEYDYYYYDDVLNPLHSCRKYFKYGKSGSVNLYYPDLYYYNIYDYIGNYPGVIDEYNNHGEFLQSTYYEYDTVYLDIETISENNCICYPNPVEDLLNINLKYYKNSIIKIDFFNINGVVEYSVNENHSSGICTYTISTEFLGSGLYHLKITSSDGFSFFKKVMVL
jgi:hypothetical protein